MDFRGALVEFKCLIPLEEIEKLFETGSCAISLRQVLESEEMKQKVNSILQEIWDWIDYLELDLIEEIILKKFASEESIWSTIRLKIMFQAVNDAITECLIKGKALKEIVPLKISLEKGMEEIDLLKEKIIIECAKMLNYANPGDEGFDSPQRFILE